MSEDIHSSLVTYQTRGLDRTFLETYVTIQSIAFQSCSQINICNTNARVEPAWAWYAQAMRVPNLFHILIAEDEPNVAASLCAALQLRMGQSLCIACCTTGEDATGLLAAGHFDLLITDHKLPGMSGLELLHYVRRRYPALPSILMTGYGTPDLEKAVHLLGCPYLGKPFSIAKFMDTVQCLLKEGNG